MRPPEEIKAWLSGLHFEDGRLLEVRTGAESHLFWSRGGGQSADRTLPDLIRINGLPLFYGPQDFAAFDAALRSSSSSVIRRFSFFGVEGMVFSVEVLQN